MNNAVVLTITDMRLHSSKAVSQKEKKTVHILESCERLHLQNVAAINRRGIRILENKRLDYKRVRGTRSAHPCGAQNIALLPQVTCLSRPSLSRFQCDKIQTNVSVYQIQSISV